jgi:hypothetical protein
MRSVLRVAADDWNNMDCPQHLSSFKTLIALSCRDNPVADEGTIRPGSI